MSAEAKNFSSKIDEQRRVVKHGQMLSGYDLNHLLAGVG